MDAALTEALLKWDNAKKVLASAKDEEMHFRKVAFELGFGADAKEGTNNLELNGGYVLKGVKKLSYNIVAPEGKDKITAVDDVIDNFAKIGNEGTFVADRLFKWDVTLSVSEYRLIQEQAENGSGEARAMLLALQPVLEIREGAPTLDIKEPKGKK